MATGENNPKLISADNFSVELSEQYHLSIEVSLSEFKFVILDTKDITYKHLEIHQFNSKKFDRISDELRTIISNNNVLKNTFSSLSVAYSNFPSTLIPCSVYNQADESKILSLNTDIFECILRDEITSQNAKLIYSVPEKIKSTIDTFFPKIKSNSLETILIKEYEKITREKPTAYININQNSVLITIFNKKNLIFNNSFDFITKEDLLYYVLFSFEQLKFSPEKTKVILFGDINFFEEKYKLMYDYIREIDFGKRNKSLTYDDKFNCLEECDHFGLFSQILCA